MKKFVFWACCGSVVVALACLVVVVSCYYRAAAEARDRLATIKAAGLPTTPEAVRKYCESLRVKPDISDEWLQTFELIQDDKFSAKSLPAYFDDYSPPGQVWPRRGRAEELLAEHRSMVDAIRHTARKKGGVRFPVDYRDMPEVDLPHLNNARTVATLLALDAAVQAHRGNADEFTESVEAILEVSAKLDNEMLLCGQIVRLSIHQQGVDAIHVSLSRTPIPTEASQRLRTLLRQSDHLSALRRSFIGERGAMTKCFSDFEGLARVKGGVWTAFAQADLCWYLDYMQAAIDACERPWPYAWTQSAEITQLEELIGEHWPGPVITMIVSPATLPAIAAAGRAEFYDRACRVGLAIEEYRTRHQRIPQSLEELVPMYLEELPTDPFDGQTLRFQKWDGGYRIYSVGENGSDDGGLGPEEPDDHVASGLDYVFEVPSPFKRVDHGEGVEPPGGYTGIWYVYWPNGKLKLKTRYINGVRHGVEEQHFADGSLMTTEYQRGKREGDCEVFSASGVFIADGTFKNDKPFQGTFREWDGDDETFVHYYDGVRFIRD